MSLLAPRPRPCATCPYRRDVPSGIWNRKMYEILPGYDGDTTTQAAAGATALFMCHQDDGHLCSGWAGCHDMEESFAMRLHSEQTDWRAVHEYQSPVPLFSSGAEACAHGLAELDHPGLAARRAVAKIIRVREARKKEGKE